MEVIAKVSKDYYNNDKALFSDSKRCQIHWGFVEYQILGQMKPVISKASKIFLVQFNVVAYSLLH